jgi:YidC/Oxa1 family membrane protein insertase
MDRNSAIGLTLIAALLLVYFYFFAAKPVPQDKIEQAVASQVSPSDSTKQKTLATEPAIDSATIRQYGNLGSYLSGTEVETKVDSKELSISFSNHATIKNLELKNYKTYTKKPLFLVTPQTNSFALVGQYEGKEINLYSLYYRASTSKIGDTTQVVFEADLANGASLKHVYSIPSAGFEVGYRIETKGLTSTLTGESLTFTWHDKIPLVEKDIKDSRTKTTINYYLAEDKFDGLSESAMDFKSEAFAKPLKWIAIRQKFFINSIIAKNTFSGGEISTQGNERDSSTVKEANVKLFIPKADVLASKANFTYYFGPNDYRITPRVTKDFSLNLSLGWPPMLWINKFVIIPVFHFLEGFIGNYGLIIVLLVIFVKLVLAPLSYSSYMGMAKMKLLKPELDAIKEKNGDNTVQQQQDQMKLYQQAGVNPFSGCIPILLQMPILLAMFSLFPVSIELRQKTFLWADDLSTYDSLIQLPFNVPFLGAHISLFVVLMTVSQLFTTWQNNQMSTVDGPMKSMGYIMPIVFMFILNSFSAGLSFYYLVSNLATLAQQAIIKRFVDEDKIKAIIEENKKKAATGTPTKSKFMNKLSEAMKASEEARKAAEARKKKG